MRSTFAGLALVAAVAASPVPQSSSGCVTTYPGSFEIQVVNATSSKVKRQAIVLSITLQDGGLTDSEGRIGYIASNKQFQFDAGQPQAGAEGINSFSVCGDLLAHSGVTTWDACKSGGFSNLYSDNSIAAGNPGQCTEVNIQVIPSSGDTTTAAATSAATSAAATEITDGQPQATVATAAATQITDGQVQATVAPATQITDGQVQATVAPATQITDGQVQATVAPATQITDGQVQATVAPATQITDGQVQATVVASTGVAPYPGANTTVAGSAPSVVPATGAAASFTMGSSIVGLVAVVAALAVF